MYKTLINLLADKQWHITTGMQVIAKRPIVDNSNEEDVTIVSYINIKAPCSVRVHSSYIEFCMLGNNSTVLTLRKEGVFSVSLNETIITIKPIEASMTDIYLKEIEEE